MATVCIPSFHTGYDQIPSHHDNTVKISAEAHMRLQASIDLHVTLCEMGLRKSCISIWKHVRWC